MNVQIKVRHPIKGAVSTIPVDKRCTVNDAKLTILKHLNLYYKIDETILITEPSFLSSGQQLDDKAFIEDVYKFEKDIIEVCFEPVVILVCVSDGASYLKAEKLLVDITKPLGNSINVLLPALVKSTNEQYVFQAISGETITWLNSNKSLKDLDFNASEQSLCLYPTKEVAKRWQMLCRKEEKSGFLLLQQGSSVDNLEKKVKRWCTIIGIFLLVFKNKTDPFPSIVIPLDFHTLKLKRDEKLQPYIMLKLVDKRFNSSRNRNVYALSTDDTNAKDILDSWHEGMMDKCINTGEKRVFGVPLEKVMSHESKIPPIVSKTISYLDQHGLEIEGVFRHSGSPSLTEHYRDEFEIGLEPDFTDCNDPHTVAALLKQFFRDLPEPLLTFDNYSKFIEIASIKETPTDEKVKQVFALVETLPPEHQIILKHLLSFLNRVSRLSDLNKMTVANLAMVFGPNLLRPLNDTPMTLMQDAPCVNEVVGILIQYESKLNPSILRNSSSKDSKIAQRKFTYMPPMNPGSPKQYRKENRSFTISGDNNRFSIGGGGWSQKADFFQSEKAKQTLNSTPPAWKRLASKEGILSYKTTKKLMWKDRYAVITPTTIYLFKSSKDKETSEPSGVIPLKDAKLSMAFAGGKNSIKLVVLSDYSIFFHTRSSELNEWYKAIEATLLKNNTSEKKDIEELEQEESKWMEQNKQRKEQRQSLKLAENKKIINQSGETKPIIVGGSQNSNTPKGDNSNPQSQDVDMSVLMKKIQDLETLVYKQAAKIATLEDEVKQLKFKLK